MRVRVASFVLVTVNFDNMRYRCIVVTVSKQNPKPEEAKMVNYYNIPSVELINRYPSDQLVVFNGHSFYESDVSEPLWEELRLDLGREPEFSEFDEWMFANPDAVLNWLNDLIFSRIEAGLDNDPFGVVS